MSGEHLEETKKKTKVIIFDIILLSTGLSDIGGQKAYNFLLRNGVTSPIIILIYPNIDEKNILGFEGCASNYIFKPFRLGALLSCMRAQFHQQMLGKKVKLTIGPYIFQPLKKLLTIKENHKEIYLTDKETAILEYLFNASQCATSRDILLGEVWGYNESVTSHTLETHIYRLRQKIEIDSSNAIILITETGGYRLVP